VSAPGLPLCVKSQRVMYVLIKLTHRVSAKGMQTCSFSSIFPSKPVFMCFTIINAGISIWGFTSASTLMMKIGSYVRKI